MNYSEATIEKFLNENFFLKDKTLKKYYEDNKVLLFRKRYERIGGTSDKLEKVIYTFITSSIRFLIYRIISELTVFLKPMGDLIVTGGEAFNMYFEQKDKIITSDIDTKFIPIFKLDKDYFYKLQSTKILLWEKLGEIAKKYNKLIVNNIPVNNKILKFLGVGFGNNGPWVTRRYSLISKSKTGTPPVLTDIELFTLDLKIKYYSLKHKKVVEQNLAGILDIAFMRPNEFGFEISKSKQKGIIYYDPTKKKQIHDKDVLIAGKKFLLEDVYILQTLGLRPEKIKKDKERLIKFSKNVLRVKDISLRDNIYTIFKKAIKKIPQEKRVLIKRSKFNPNLAKNVNVTAHKKYTTEQDKSKIIKQFVLGSQVPKKGYKKTNSNFRFNTETLKWVKNNRNEYVRNRFKFRKEKVENTNKLPRFMNKRKLLHSFNPRRNYNIPESIIDKATQIPFIGLKNTNSLYKNVVRNSDKKR